MASFHLYHQQASHQYNKHIFGGMYIDYYLRLRQSIEHK